MYVSACLLGGVYRQLIMQIVVPCGSVGAVRHWLPKAQDTAGWASPRIVAHLCAATPLVAHLCAATPLVAHERPQTGRPRGQTPTRMRIIITPTRRFLEELW